MFLSNRVGLDHNEFPNGIRNRFNALREGLQVSVTAEGEVVASANVCNHKFTLGDRDEPYHQTFESIGQVIFAMIS